MRLRTFKADDLEAVASLWWRSWHGAFPGVQHPQPFAQWVARLRDDLLPQGITWVAEDDELVLGFLLLTDGGTYIHQMFVEPDHQRRGIGSLLMAKAKELSPNSLTLATATRNLVARRFYEKHGFQVVKHGRGGVTREPSLEYRWQPGT